MACHLSFGLTAPYYECFVFFFLLLLSRLIVYFVNKVALNLHGFEFVGITRSQIIYSAIMFVCICISCGLVFVFIELIAANVD